MFSHHHLPPSCSQVSPRRKGAGGTALLIILLVAIHLPLLAIGTFCASVALNPHTPHHAEHESSASILCEWACHVGQIATYTTPTEIFSLLPPLIALSNFSHITTPSTSITFSLASPRAPPVADILI